VRAETLSLETFVTLSNLLTEEHFAPQNGSDK